jgi:hypothetical protein
MILRLRGSSLLKVVAVKSGGEFLASFAQRTVVHVAYLFHVDSRVQFHPEAAG